MRWEAGVLDSVLELEDCGANASCNARFPVLHADGVLSSGSAEFNSLGQDRRATAALAGCPDTSMDLDIIGEIVYLNSG
jgi:hypothetical protein